MIELNQDCSVRSNLENHQRVENTVQNQPQFRLENNQSKRSEMDELTAFLKAHRAQKAPLGRRHQSASRLPVRTTRKRFNMKTNPLGIVTGQKKQLVEQQKCFEKDKRENVVVDQTQKLQKATYCEATSTPTKTLASKHEQSMLRNEASTVKRFHNDSQLQHQRSPTVQIVSKNQNLAVHSSTTNDPYQSYLHKNFDTEESGLHASSAEDIETSNMLKNFEKYT